MPRPPKEPALDADASEDKAPKLEPVKRGRTPGRKPASLEPRLGEMFAGLGAMIYAFDAECGGVVVTQAPALAAALNRVAADNRNVYKALDRMLTGGAWGGVIMAIAPIVITVGRHHGLLPGQIADAIDAVPDDSLGAGVPLP